MRNFRTWATAAGLGCVAAGAVPVHALTQIESLYWGTPATVNGCRSVTVSFVGRVTAADITDGVRFSLQERDADGNDLLLDAALPWSAPYPTIGTEVRIWAVMDVCCSPTGRLSGTAVSSWTVSWCEPPAPAQTRFRNSTTPARSVGSSEPEAFELVLVDETGQEGSSPTAEDVIVCGGGPELSASVEMPPWPADLLRQGHGLMPDLAPVFGQLRYDPDRTASEPTGTLGLYFDEAGRQACGAAIPFTGVTLYGVLHTAGITRCGVAGAEFRITNLPAGWLAGLTVLPGGLVLGNPLGNGCSVGFGQCMGNPLGAIPLFTVQTIPVSVVSDHVMSIAQASPTSNDVFQCPWVVLCDAPIFTGVCVEGGAAVLNPSPATPCGATVGVRSGTWGAVKRLYN